MTVRYKAEGRRVYVKRNGRWQLYEEHPTKERARRQAVALMMR